MKTLATIIIVAGSAALGAAANFAFWFHLANTDPDPTVGGAYAAMMTLCLLPSLLVGGGIGAFIASRR